MAQVMFVNVVGGDIKSGLYVLNKGLLKESKLFRPLKINLVNNLVSLDKVGEEDAKKFLGSVGMGIVGGVLLGGVGAIAGVLSGGNNRKVSFICNLRDGRKFLATTDSQTHNALLLLEMKSEPSYPSNNNARSVNNHTRSVNFYEILGIPANANNEEIRNAIAQAELIGITEPNILAAAKRALLNPNIRQQYDNRLFGSHLQQRQIGAANSTQANTATRASLDHSAQHNHAPTKEPIKNIVTHATGMTLSWIFGVLFLLTGFVALFSSISIAIIYLCIAAVLLPPVRKFAFLKTQMPLPFPIRGIIIFILMIAAGILGSSSDTTKTVAPTASINTDKMVQASVVSSQEITAYEENKKREQQEAEGAAKEKTQIEIAKNNQLLRKLITTKLTKAIKESAREPSSIEWMSIYGKADASSVCIEYRGKNGFGGMSIEQVVYGADKVMSAKDNPKFWNKHCVGSGFIDIKKELYL